MHEIPILFYLIVALFTYQLYFFLRYIVILLKKSTNSQEKPKAVSVIICAHNEFENLKMHLPLILNQAHDNFEVIVVDDRSHDQTYEWLLEQQEQHESLRVARLDHVPKHINNKKYALTIGIKAAKNELILLTDADCKPNSPLWIDRMSRSFLENTEMVLGVSLYNKEAGLLNSFIRYETYKTAIQYLSRAISGKAYMGVGRNMAYKKSLFLNQKGFHGYQGLTGGDDDLFVNKNAQKNNTEVNLSADAITFSIPKKSWKALYNQKKRHFGVGKHYRLRDKIFLTAIQFSSVLIYVFYLCGVFLLSTELFMITTAILLLRWIGQYVVFYRLSIKFGDKFQPWFLPFVECFELFYYFIVGLRAIRAKRIQWK